MKAPTFAFDAVKCLAIVSDSHGLLRDSVMAALQDVDLIIHAGDLGFRGLLERLEAVAPVIAVRVSILWRMSLFSFRNWRALSRPWPRRSPL